MYFEGGGGIPLYAVAELGIMKETGLWMERSSGQAWRGWGGGARGGVDLGPGCGVLSCVVFLRL